MRNALWLSALLSLLTIFWVALIVHGYDADMRACQQDHSYDTCFTQLNH